MFRRKPKVEVQPEWLIVGLGNPGGEYDGTRHNVGFEVVRVLSERHRIRLKVRRLRANFGLGGLGGARVVFARPMTFMNLSGHAVSHLLRYFNLPAERLIVTTDDMDLEVGRVRIKPKGGAGTHRGLRSIIESLQTEGFPRVRVGIGSPSWSGVDHVLSRFDPDEVGPIRDAIERAADGCELIVERGIEIAMNRVNLPSEPH